ncbi:hypothetical protein ACFY94_22225 [Streptomyces griseorubiginosus]|uniref:hypothetical protein n=1 Tax=Streptomyces griseorubiginosus TaxID=67304 RepID=UPI0036E595C1
MDAGLAAVLGALAGAAGTTGAAFAASWATREQARIAARSEHRRQRREPRLEIYKNFIQSANSVADHLRTLSSRSGERRIGTISTEYLDELERLVGDLSEQRDSAMLAGPDLISELGENVALRAIHVHLILQGWWLASQRSGSNGEESLNEAVAEIQEYIDRIRSFAREARDTLDDDGSKKYRRHYRYLG